MLLASAGVGADAGMRPSAVQSGNACSGTAAGLTAVPPGCRSAAASLGCSFAMIPPKVSFMKQFHSATLPTFM